MGRSVLRCIRLPLLSSLHPTNPQLAAGAYFETGLVPRLPTAILSTGLMVLAFLSVAIGLVLVTVTRGRREMKLLAYLAHRAPGEERRRE